MDSIYPLFEFKFIVYYCISYSFHRELLVVVMVVAAAVTVTMVVMMVIWCHSNHPTISNHHHISTHIIIVRSSSLPSECRLIFSVRTTQSQYTAPSLIGWIVSSIYTNRFKIYLATCFAIFYIPPPPYLSPAPDLPTLFHSPKTALAYSIES